jgi:polar amino acid transport system substrate-binding protein
MGLSLVACGSKGSQDAADSSSDSADSSASASVEDLKKVKDSGTLVIGITDFEPMDYKDSSGNWVGFDADMANEFAKKLGVEAKFVEIEWDNKALELDSGNIDCVWNGMTLTDEVKSSMDCSNPYCNNAQIVIVPTDKADQYQTVDSLTDLSFAVEVGSAGEEQAKANELNYTAVANQANALMEVSAGTADAAIIDSLMAAAMVGEGTSYEDLTYTISLNSEEYGVGFRKGSDLRDELNTFLKESYDDGTIDKIAEEYGVSAAIVEQK